MFTVHPPRLKDNRRTIYALMFIQATIGILFGLILFNMIKIDPELKPFIYYPLGFMLGLSTFRPWWWGYMVSITCHIITAGLLGLVYVLTDPGIQSEIAHGGILNIMIVGPIALTIGLIMAIIFPYFFPQFLAFALVGIFTSKKLNPLKVW